MATTNGGLKKLIQESFPGGVDETTERYVDRLLIVWDECTKAVGRYVTVLLAAITAFELINRAIVKEFSIGPLKVVNVSVIKDFLPVLASYFMFRIMSELVRWRQIEQVYVALVEHFYPTLYKTNLELLLYPVSPLQTSPLRRTEFLSGRELNFVGWLQYLLGITLLLLGPLFNFYAYWQLFAVHGFDITTLISVMLSTLFLGAYATLIALYGFTAVFLRHSYTRMPWQGTRPPIRR